MEYANWIERKAGALLPERASASLHGTRAHNCKYDEWGDISGRVLTAIPFLCSRSLLHSCENSSWFAPVLASLTGGRSTSVKEVHTSVRSA